MSACEKCWRDASARALHLGGSVTEHYRALLEERKDNPCPPESRSLPAGDGDPYRSGENTPPGSENTICPACILSDPRIRLCVVHAQDAGDGDPDAIRALIAQWRIDGPDAIREAQEKRLYIAAATIAARRACADELDALYPAEGSAPAPAQASVPSGSASPDQSCGCVLDGPVLLHRVDDCRREHGVALYPAEGSAPTLLSGMDLHMAARAWMRDHAGFLTHKPTCAADCLDGSACNCGLLTLAETIVRAVSPRSTPPDAP